MMKIALTIALVAFPAVFGCKCTETTDVEKYCASDFAVFATISDKHTSAGPQSVYLLRVNESLKPGPPIMNVFSQQNDCEVQMKRGKTYLIAGQRVGGMLTIDQCTSLVVPVKGSGDIAALKKKYQNSC